MTVRYCTRCKKPYGEAVDGVTNAVTSYAPFCSKRCADVDLVHWLKGDYRIGDAGELALADDDEAPVAKAPAPDDGES